MDDKGGVKMKETETNFVKVWNKIKEKAVITFSDYEEIQDVLWKQQLKIEELTKSRDNWKNKYMGIKEK
jgi:hypothetical protein